MYSLRGRLTMPYIEIVEELATDIADILGITEREDIIKGLGKVHKKECNCRVCFIEKMSKRIRLSVENEKKLGTTHE